MKKIYIAAELDMNNLTCTHLNYFATPEAANRWLMNKYPHRIGCDYIIKEAR